MDFPHFFCLVRFVSARLTSSPPFFLPGVVSPPANIVTPPRHVMLCSYLAKVSSLSLLHLTVTLCPIVSPLESKLKH
jgi:hypothetical protein